MGLDLGNKRTILKELRDRAVAGDDEPVPVIQRSWYQEALTEPDPLRCLQLHARNIVRMHTRYAELAEVLRVGAAVEPELRELWQLGHDQRRIGAAIMVDALLSKTALKPGLDRDAAIDQLWVLTGSDLYRGLIGVCGWTVERFERWLGDTFCDQLLGHRRRDSTTGPV